VGQIPLYYNALPTGRPFEAENKYTSKYLDVPNTPLYPFGFGLSYTTFKTSGLQLNSANIARTGELTISVDIENNGTRTGTEVVQVYVHDVAASMSRPVKELKGFQRVTLNAGEKRKIEVTIRARDLGFYNAANQYVFEDGKFDVFVGTNSQDEGLRGSFSIVGK
jgi:beta-glucosidase